MFQLTHNQPQPISFRYARFGQQLLDQAPSQCDQSNALVLMVLARIARIEGDIGRALALIESVATTNKPIVVLYEAALINHEVGNFRLARRILSRLKSRLEHPKTVLKSFWPIPLPKFWPCISKKHLLIALKVAHDHVVQQGPAIWEDDDKCHVCPACEQEFGVFRRKHHCRSCGTVVCDSCSLHREYLAKPSTFFPIDGQVDEAEPCVLQRVCNPCKKDFESLHSSDQLSNINIGAF